LPAKKKKNNNILKKIKSSNMYMASKTQLGVVAADDMAKRLADQLKEEPKNG